MKTRPKEGERVYQIYTCSFGCGVVESKKDFVVDYKFNCFPTRKQAEAARKKIIQVLKGG